MRTERPRVCLIPFILSFFLCSLIHFCCENALGEQQRDFEVDSPYFQWVKEYVVPETELCRGPISRIDKKLRVRCDIAAHDLKDGYFCGVISDDLKILPVENCDGITWPERNEAVSPDSARWIATRNGIKVVSADGLESMITGAEGLPYEDVTAIDLGAGGTAWIGTARGAVYFDGESWFYFAGRRWLPDDRVNDIVFAADGGAWIATNAGVVHLARKEMSLERKALIFDDAMQARHNRDGFIAESPLGTPGDVSSYYLSDDDNDGQWTEMYLAAECFRYASTGDPAALANARKSLDAMLLLLTVSPAKGFPARSVLPPDKCPGRDSVKWRIITDGNICWKGDTSTDEVVGHMFGLPIFYDLCANENEKKRIAGAVAPMMDRIIENGYTLTGPDGKVTTDGHWDPLWINKGQGRLGDRGLNSVEILSALLSAYHITGDKRYLDCYNKLIDEYGYNKNALHWKTISDQYQKNYDSYEMGYLSFYNLLRYETDDNLWKNYYFEGLRLAMEEEYGARNAEQIVIFGVFARAGYGLDLAVRTLRELPVDLIKHSVFNSVRADMAVSSKKDRFRRMQSRFVPPYMEVGTVRWSENMFALDFPDGSGAEVMAQFYLLPYWMARYHGIIR
jgi:hypothetical protein